MDSYEAPFPSKEAYFAFVDSLDMDKRTVVYEEDGTVRLEFVN